MRVMEIPRLRDLELYGLETIEDSLWAALITADPVLLIGGHGTAKTTLAEKLAQALGETFWAYDASKALFEDVIGFPDPTALAQGECRYIPTRLSIWDKTFILIDEISRATPSMQNKWLEIIRSRRVMGIPMEKIKYIFAAMNPPSYQGAYPLDQALVGRFGFILRMPEVWEMEVQDMERVTTLLTPSDAPGLPRERVQGDGDLGLTHFIQEGRETYPQAEGIYGERLLEILVNLSRVLSARGREMALDGRRLGLIYRGLLALFSVKILKGEAEEVEFMLQTPLALYDRGLKHLLPYATQEDEVKNRLGELSLMVAYSRKEGERKAPSRKLDPVQALSLARMGEVLTQEEADSAAEDLVKSLSCQVSKEEFVNLILVFQEFLRGIMEGRLRVGFRNKIRLLKLWQKVTGANLATPEDLAEAAKEVPLDTEDPGFVGRCAIIAAYEEVTDNLEREEVLDFYFRLLEAKEDWYEVACL